MAILRAARQFGYQRIKVQSNGMLFAYEAFTAKAVAAGMTEVNLLLKSLDAKVHDALNRTPGSHAALTQAIDVLRRQPLRLEGDVLVTTRNVEELPDVIEHYAGLGLKHFNLWLFSLVDQGDADLRRLVPSMHELVPAMLAARTAAHRHGATVVSLNTPHCVVPPDTWDLQFDAARMRLLVVNPDGNAFALESSSIERGAYVAACSSCAARPWCHGIRPDFLEVHGEAWVTPVTEAVLSLGNPVGSVLDA
jgi:MoaA/NifB/PqqE/SkfB family radical SAM enzyme